MKYSFFLNEIYLQFIGSSPPLYSSLPSCLVSISGVSRLNRRAINFATDLAPMADASIHARAVSMALG